MKALLKYKIGLAGLGLLTVGLVIFVVVQAGGAKQDTQTTQAANDIATKLNNYISEKYVIPASLSAAGVKDVPQTIQYKKLSDTTYRFCVTYKNASSDFYATGVQDAVNAYSGNLGATEDDMSQNTTLYIPTQHHKGSTCQTVVSYFAASTYYPAQTDPKQSATASGNQSSACGQNEFKTHYSGTITGVKTADGSPIVSTANQPIVVTVKPNGTTPKGAQMLSIDQSSGDFAKVFNVYNSECTTIEASGMQAGDDVSVFLDNSQSYMPNAVIDFSQN